MAAPSSNSSQAQLGSELILAACNGRPVTAYDALSGGVVAEFAEAGNTPRHGLAVATGGGAASFVAASHVCPATGAGSVRLLQWWSRAPARELPVPEPVAPLVAAPHGSHILAGGVSGCVHALALPSGNVACSFRAHSGAAVSCLALNDDGSLLLTSGDDGEVAVFPLLRVLDVDADTTGPTDLSIYRVAAHAAPVICVACGHGGCNAVVATASVDGTCKVWNLTDGSHLRTLTLPCAALSLALDPTTDNLFAGGSDGCVHAASVNSPGAITATSSCCHASGKANAALVGVGMANGCKNLVTCTDDGEAMVWDLTSGLLTATFRIGGTVTDVLLVKLVTGEVARGGRGEGVFKARDGEAWTTASEVAQMEQRLRASEVGKARSVELVEMAVGGYKRSLRLMLREVTTTTANGTNGEGHATASD